MPEEEFLSDSPYLGAFLVRPGLRHGWCHGVISSPATIIYLTVPYSTVHLRYAWTLEIVKPCVWRRAAPAPDVRACVPGIAGPRWRARPDVRCRPDYVCPARRDLQMPTCSRTRPQLNR
jgi:hypothetical protein